MARSSDGERFEQMVALPAKDFGAQSLERPALAVTPDGTWRLYVGCATPGGNRWRIELLEAADPSQFRPADARVVAPGDDRFAVKDPVLVRHDGAWHMWACFHPVKPAEDSDRMETRHAVSADGVEWRWDATALTGTPSRWDSRGARFTTVLFRPGEVVAYYDGRASKDENFEERTGLAVSADGIRFRPVGDRPVAASPYGAGGLRYLSVVSLPEGRHRLYYERSRSDGAHELVTELVDSASTIG